MTFAFRSLAVLPLLLGAAAARGGDDVSDLAGLLNEPVVTTASKSAETAGLAPATTSIITGDDLRRHGIDSLHDAINYLALGMLTEPAHATPEIGARGVLLTGDYGNHVLLLLDGHAVNEPWDGTAYYDWTAAIPLDLVDHVEVILGPGSVLYGSSAMLGVINVITKRARDYDGLHAVGQGAYPTAGHASLGFGKPIALQEGRAGGLTAAFDWFHSSGPPLDYTRQPYDGVSWGGRATHRQIDVPAGLARLVLGGFDVEARAAQSRRAATQILGDFDDPDNYERDRWLSLDARWSGDLGPIQLTARAYGDLYDYHAHQPWTATVDCLEGQTHCAYVLTGVSRWAGGELSVTRDWAGDGRFVTLVGAEVRRVSVTSIVDYRDTDTGVDTRASSFTKGTTVLGVYLQQTLRPVRWLSVNAGLRLDHDGEMGSHLSPRAAVVIPAWTGGTLKAIYSEAFRAPSFYERFYADPTNQLQAQDLRPETVRSVEGVIEQRVGAQRVRLGVFRSWWRDLVVTVPASDQQVTDAIAAGKLVPGATGVYLYANASRIESWGLEADWEGSGLGQRLRYGASITAAHSRAVSDGAETPLPGAAQLFGNARVSWEPGGKLPTLGLAVRAVASRPVAGTDYDPPPHARPVFEGRAALSGPLAGGLSYSLAFDWVSTGSSAYAVGPARSPDNGLGMQPVLPLPRYRVMAGLRFDR